MARISLRSELEAQGLARAELNRQLRGGELQRVRRGAYADPLPVGAGATATHRRLVAAAMRQLSEDAVLSHVSAAVWHGLPTWPEELRRVQVTPDRSGGGRSRPDLWVRGLPLEPGEVVRVDGQRVTSLARTVLDVSCVLPLEKAVAVGDAALRQGLDRTELTETFARAKGRHGVAGARCALALLDPRSESPGESVSRVLFHRHGVAAPEFAD